MMKKQTDDRVDAVPAGTAAAVNLVKLAALSTLLVLLVVTLVLGKQVLIPLVIATLADAWIATALAGIRLHGASERYSRQFMNRDRLSKAFFPS